MRQVCRAARLFGPGLITGLSDKLAELADRDLGLAEPEPVGEAIEFLSGCQLSGGDPDEDRAILRIAPFAGVLRPCRSAENRQTQEDALD